MTEQKSVAWTYEYHNGETWKRLLVYFDPSRRDPGDQTPIRNVQAWTCFPQPVEEPKQKPVAWSYSWAFGEVLTRHDPTDRHDYGLLRDVRPLYDHPAPAQPATDPAVEAARRKALRAILKLLENYPWACDTCPDVELSFGHLRDLVGQPRKYPDRAIRGYDNDGPPGPRPVFGKRGEPELAQLSVEYLASVIANNGATRVDPTGMWVVNIAKAVHAAVYGGPPTRGEMKGDE